MEWQQWPSLPLTERTALPLQPGIYVVVDAEAQVWYVGLSRNLHARWNGGRGHHRYEQLKRSHSKRSYRIHWQFCPVERLVAQERYYIDLFRPRLNYSPVKTYLRPTLQPHQELSRIFKVINHKTRLFPDVRSVVLGYYRELDEDEESGELKEFTCIVTAVDVNDHDRVILKSCQKSVTRKGFALKDCWFMFECNCGQSDPVRPAMTPVFLHDGLVYEFPCHYGLLDSLRQQRAGLYTVDLAQQPVLALRDPSLLVTLLADHKSRASHSDYLYYRAPQLRPISELLEFPKPQ